jgi:hypothetical protein
MWFAPSVKLLLMVRVLRELGSKKPRMEQKKVEEVQ